jgi:hypothetical protein
VTLDQMIAAAEKYKAHLVETFDAKSVRDTEGSPSSSHLVWMCDQIIAEAKNLNSMPIRPHRETMEKYNRWLGFVQGALWVIGDYKIEELKSDNRAKEG